MLYIDGVRKPFHLTNLWKSDSEGVIMSGKTGAEFLDEKIVDALDRALDRDKDVRVVIYEPYDEKERRRQKDRREDEEFEDDEIEDPEDDELLDDDDIPF